jgi:N-acylneuraminate cytidylyltransferase
MPAGSSIERRQDLPAVYVENGAIYVAQTAYLLKAKKFITEETLAYIMPAERSWDIDTETDFRFCELIKTNSLGT